ncbi:MAG: PAS domain-containing protein [Proteobacteria bacterium]|nr:PAS domain-containing protein [Pseudomonadota bacterium]MBU1582456.1 PAS domain-containing protein [Pseudomonadota bacterium]MBU2452167.1 PAS domain-containing protein [Pseudomonadota bacterium]MBU2630633.1 PAS domain-containing protein [Pseudomonadota bacterium]
MTTEKEQVFTTLKQLANLMTQMFGDNCEVAIHDLTTQHMHLIYITGNVTRRVPGAPVTDAVAKYLIRDGHQVKDRHCFMTLTDDGRELKSSTSYIRDSKGKVIAAFCINFNTTDHHNAIQLLMSFVNKNASDKITDGMTDNLPERMSFSIDNTVDSLFEQSVAEIGKRPASMITDEKIRLVKLLEKKGAFQIRGVVSQVALRLGVSNFTIYNYLKKIRAANGTAIRDII